MPIYRDADWETRPRFKGGDLQKKRLGPYIYRYFDIRFSDFIMKIVTPEANIFKPADIRRVAIWNRNHDNFEIEINFEGFELWFEKKWLDAECYDPLQSVFGHNLYGSPPPLTQTVYEVSFYTQSHSQHTPHYIAYEPTFELMQLALTNNKIFFQTTRWEVTDPPLVIKPGQYVRGFEDCPNHFLVVDNPYDFYEYSESNSNISEANTEYSDFIPRAIKRFETVHIVDHDYYLDQETPFVDVKGLSDDRNLIFEQTRIINYLFEGRLDGVTIEDNSPDSMIYYPSKNAASSAL